VTHVSFRILGRLEVVVDGRVVDLPSRRERALLGVLLLHVGEVVSVDALIDSVWGERPPVSARHMVHEYVSRLRGALGDASVIATRAPGYLVEREARELDAARFADLLGLARAGVAAEDLSEALKAYDEALGLWRGDALSGLALEGDARSAATSLDGQRRAARSERVEVGLAFGHHHQLIPELERAVDAEPFDEQLRGQLMLALYRDGRQADALERYREGRRTLVEQVGIEPGAELRALEQAILRHDSALALPSAGEAFTVSDETTARRPRAWRRRTRRLAAAAVVVSIAGLATIAAVFARKAPSAAASVRGDAVAVVDAAHARLLGSVPVTAPPGAIAYGAGSVWVSSPDARSVLRISPESRRVAASIPLAVAPQSLAVDGSAVWALGSGPNDEFLTLERIDPTFGTVSRVRRLPTVVTGDTGSLSTRGDTLLVAPRTGLLTKIDVRSGHVLGRLDPNAAPSAAAFGFGSSWLAYREADLVVRVDSLGAITQIPVGREPSAIAVGKRAVWVANALDGTVESIDPATGAAITRVQVGRNPTALAAADDSVWVASGGDGKLVRIDERSSRVTATVAIGGSPQSLVVAEGKVWASVQTPPAAQPSGGTAVVSVTPGMSTLDPAVAFGGSAIEYATCAGLLNFPDQPGSAGLRVVPDAARSLPTVSKDGRSYTFTIRPGMRFSPPSNQLVTGQTFKHTIERSLSPHLGDGAPPGQMFLRDVVGAGAYIAGKARHIAGIEARGDRLTIHLIARAPDLPARLAVSPFCAVPTDTPIRPVSGLIPSAGPYYAASVTPGRGFVLLRNPNYHGDRPHRLQRIEVVVGAPHPIAQIEASKLDYAFGDVPAGQTARLERLYGAHSDPARRGQQRYFTYRTLAVDYLDLNTGRPLFASARMRQAVGYAVDRSALAANGGSFSTAAAPAQMNIPPGEPGFRDRRLYPLVPDVATARRLAGGGRHDATLYCVLEAGSERAAQIIRNNLAAIGIDVHVHCVPGYEMWTLLSRPHEPWDMAVDGFGANYGDPGEFINGLAFDDGFNFSHYHDPALNRKIRAASRLSGAARAQAYARIDLELTRDLVPSINFDNPVEEDFFSARMGCQLYQPLEGIDLAALCIRPGGRDARRR
jgi:DNA-binding SARP family transcriptional activator/ABC-type transport system substrate-binding protein